MQNRLLMSVIRVGGKSDMIFVNCDRVIHDMQGALFLWEEINDPSLKWRREFRSFLSGDMLVGGQALCPLKGLHVVWVGGKGVLPKRFQLEVVSPSPLPWPKFHVTYLDLKVDGFARCGFSLLAPLWHHCRSRSGLSGSG